MLITPGMRAQVAATQASPGGSGAGSAPADSSEQVKKEIETLKKSIAALEERLAAQEKQEKQKQDEKQQASVAELKSDVKDLDQRVSATERNQSMDRLHFTGDYRFEAHSIRGDVPSHFDGLSLQNLVIRTMFSMPILGRTPTSVDEINRTVGAHQTDYQNFLNGLTFDKLKAAMGSFPPQLQQQLFGMLMPATFTKGYSDNNGIMYTNRVRLKFDAKVADNVTFTGRLSMYKVFGDSTGVQVFNGQPTSLNIDGTTARVPNSDQVRIDRAYFSWNNIGGSKLYVSVGRRPSTEGPPMNYRQDEPRGGTPSGGLIDYQFDGVTVGYNIRENMTWRICYGLGYESGFGNGDLLKMPQDRLKDTHFLGANLDLLNTEKTLIQATYAHAFNVADGFNGLMVMTRDPLTGEPINAPVVLRYTPSANLGSIHLFGMNATRRAKAFDLYFSGNMSNTQPNGKTTPFGGLMSDPFDVPQSHTGSMFLGGIRYNFANDERTKLGFEINHGSQYWFNFAQAADDIIAPKTNTRGEVYETYLTHRISDRFIVKADFIKYNYRYSGSGWHVGAPKALDSTPVLGFPTYSGANMFTFSLITRF
jgi:hypothetical protein